MSRKHLYMAFGVAFAIGFSIAHSSCTDDEVGTKAKGEPCDGPNQCAVPLVCLATKKCGDAPLPVTCAETAAPGCLTNTECGAGNVCSFNCCKKTCSVNADCNVTAKEQCDTGICVKSTCSATSDCGDASQVCDSGSCVQAPAAAAAASCLITPSVGVARAGHTKKFVALALDAAGKVLVAKDSFFTWTSSNSAVTLDATGLATVAGSATGEGTSTIGATITGASITCAPAATLHFFGAPAANTMRVVVVDAAGAPIAGATIADGAGVVKGTTAANGQANYALSGSAPETVTVAHNDYSWVSVYRTSSRDLLVSLAKKAASRFGWKGSVAKADFLRLVKEGGEINFGLFGASIPGNALDINLDTIVGELVETHLELSTSQAFDIPLPSGAVIGLGGNFFKGSGVDRTSGQPDPKKGLWFFSEPGTRAAWGIGGNVSITDIGPLIQQVQGGGDINVGRILSTLLPILAQLQAGAKGAVTPGEMTNTDTLAGLNDIKVELTQRLRLKQIVVLPTLPDTSTDAGNQFSDGAILLGGVDAPGRGIVPTGLSAGLDTKATGEVANGVVWGDLDGDGSLETHDGKASLRLATASGGIEGGAYVNLALAIKLSGVSLTGGSSSASSTRISGLLKRTECASLASGTACVPFDLENPPVVNFANGSFLTFPLTATRSGRTLTLNSSVDGKADLVRFDIRTDDGDWYIYADKSEATITAPTAPAGMTDRFVGAGPSFFIQSLALAGGAPDVVTFNSFNMDGLNDKLDAFSTYQMP